MYQEDMPNHEDGCGGLSPAPKVSVVDKVQPEVKISLTENSRSGLGQSVTPVERPIDHNELLSDQREQRQYHEFKGYQPPLQQQDPSIIQPGGRSRSRSQSPGRPTPSGQNRRNSSTASSSYQLMPMDKDSTSQNPNRKSLPRRLSSSLRVGKRSKTKQEEEDEKYDAQVAFVIQMAMLFFCVLISLATLLSIGIAIFTHHGYWVVILLCVTILVILVLGLCCFLYQVTNEDDAPSVNERHMPKWYRTFKKMVKDEIADFREDWMNMVNNMYLLEDGSSFFPDPAMEEEDVDSSPQIDNNQTKPKKHRGKSTLFKLVVKPVALLAGFRRKRKEKRKQKKGNAGNEPYPFPSTLV